MKAQLPITQLQLMANLVSSRPSLLSHINLKQYQTVFRFTHKYFSFCCQKKWNLLWSIILILSLHTKKEQFLNIINFMLSWFFFFKLFRLFSGGWDVFLFLFLLPACYLIGKSGNQSKVCSGSSELFLEATRLQESHTSALPVRVAARVILCSLSTSALGRSVKFRWTLKSPSAFLNNLADILSLAVWLPYRPPDQFWTQEEKCQTQSTEWEYYLETLR